jgi:dihydroxy-acid dehydratase
VTPESAIGGPLAAVRTGDRIRLSVKERELSVLLGEAELAARLATLERQPLDPRARGYRRLFLASVMQADQGCDFDFLRAPTPGGEQGDAGP